MSGSCIAEHRIRAARAAPLLMQLLIVVVAVMIVVIVMNMILTTMVIQHSVAMVFIIIKCPACRDVRRRTRVTARFYPRETAILVAFR